MMAGNLCNISLRLRILGWAWFIVFAGLVMTAPVAAQEEDTSEPANNRQSGSIDLDMSPEKKVDSYATTQDRTIAYFKNLQQTLRAGASGSINPITPPDDKILYHLGGAYLYCAIKQGICPFILESLMEIDIVNSRLANTPTCPTMKKFWKTYLANDLENRHRYSVLTGYLSTTSEFNSKVRPGLSTKCADTVKEQIQWGKPNDAYFKNRLKEGNTVQAKLAQTIAWLEQVKAKVPNVFQATGAQQ